MKYLLLTTALIATPVDAGTIQMGGQFDVPPGQHNQLTCISPPQYSQCVQLPHGAIVLGWNGSQTIKRSGIEVLAGGACNGQVMWTYEHFQGTYLITSPARVPTSMQGTCSTYWETANQGNYCVACVEINVTIFYCVPGTDCPP